jgi:hypothetical protein
MTLSDINPIDRIALLLSTGLMLLGVVVLGFIEVIAGQPYGAAPLTNDAGEVIATPMVDPNIRTGLVILGLIVLLLWGIYKMITPVQEREEHVSQQPSAAD